MSGGK